VLVLEAGPPLVDRQAHLNQFFRAAAKVPGSPWASPDKEARAPSVLEFAFGAWQDGSRHYLHQQGPLPFGSTYERLAGGTGNHWQGATPRHQPNDFRMNSEYGGPEGAPDWPIGYDDLEQWYTEAEHVIGVSGNKTDWEKHHEGKRSRDFPMPRIRLSYLDQVLKRRLDGVKIRGTTLRVHEHPQARNSIGHDGRPPCMGNANCIPMCPIQAKYDPTVHLLRSTRASTPADVRYRCVAHRVEVGSNGKVAGIHYKSWDRTRGVTEHIARGRRYVIAANAIETARLLLMSPWKRTGRRDVTVANTSDQVGRNLMDHVIHLAWGLFDEPVHPFRGPNSTSRICEFRDGRFREKYAAWMIGISNGGWGWPRGAPLSTVAAHVRKGFTGKALRDAVASHVSRQVHFTAELEQLPSQYNRVTLSKHRDALGLPKPAIRYDVSPYTRRGFRESSEVLHDVFEAIGCEHTSTDLGSPSAFNYQGKPYQARGAGHIMGTTRMGTSGAESVVNENLQCHDHKNLSIVGGSVFPTVGTANPTLTICALALRAAAHIGHSLGNHDC